MRRLEMEKAREILRLEDAGMTQREIAASTGCSLGNVNRVLSRVKAAGIADPLALKSRELGAIIYPAQEAGTDRAEPDLAYIQREMQKKGVTLTLLWEEYKAAHPEGLMLSQFCERYRRYCKQNAVYMRKSYTAGERLLVDWAGQTIHYTDRFGGQVKVMLFVATLPASSYLYVEPCADMGQESWNMAHVNAFEYFGGAPRILVPDNCKTAVIKADKRDPRINASYEELARHYGSAVIPARPYAPRDKGPVENSVKIVEQRIIAKLRERQFHSFEEVEEAVRAENEALNSQPFSKLPGSRKQVFLEVERDALRRLPAGRYEYAEWTDARVAFDYHVQFDDHYYSVPYTFAGKKVLLRATKGTIEVFFDGERITSHVRNHHKHNRYATLDEHMPPHHRAVAEWTPERFKSWGAKTGPRTEAYITHLMATRDHPEQSFKMCAGILRLGESGNKDYLEQVCGEALACNIYSWKYFDRLYRKEETKQAEPVVHENLRGREYYGSTAEAPHA